MENLQKAKELIDTEQYELAIHTLENLDELSSKDENYRLLLLSYSLYKTKKYNSSIEVANILLQKNSKNEFASQLKYLSYFELGEHDKALIEITDFLSSNKANLYTVTLEELLIDIKDGYIEDEIIIEKIQSIARKNNIKF